MQTATQIKEEMAKFNAAQRNALRERFSGRQITALHFDTRIDHVTVEFSGKALHHFYIGPRGAMKHHTVKGA